MLVENSDVAFLHILLQLPSQVLEACLLPQVRQGGGTRRTRQKKRKAFLLNPTSSFHLQAGSTEPHLQRQTALRLVAFAASPSNHIQVRDWEGCLRREVCRANGASRASVISRRLISPPSQCVHGSLFLFSPDDDDALPPRCFVPSRCCWTRW